MLMGYSRNQDAGKHFLRRIHSREVFEKWFVSQKGYAVGATTVWVGHPLWNEDPVMLHYRAPARTGRTPGFPGPSGPKAAEVVAKYIIVDVYAKAVQGMAPGQAVREAQEELVKIYSAA